MRNKLLALTFSLSLAAGGSACDFKWQKAAPPMATAKFAQVYVGLLQATVGDSLALAKADSVFQAHEIARKDFEAASRYYSEKAEQWGEVLKHVVAQLDSQMASEARKAPQNSVK